MWLNRIRSLFTSKPKVHTLGDGAKHPYPIRVAIGRPPLVKRGFSGKTEILTTRKLASGVASSYYEYVQRKPLLESREVAVGSCDIGMAVGVWEVTDMIVDCKNFGFMSELHFDTGLYTAEFIEYLAREISKTCRLNSIRTTRWLTITWDDGDDNSKHYAEKLLMALEGEYLDHV